MPWLIKLSIRIDVAVRIYRCGGRDARDIPIKLRFKRWIRMDDKEVRRTANHLVNETVVPGRTGMAALSPFPHLVKIVERASTIVLKFAEAIPDSHFLPNL